VPAGGGGGGRPVAGGHSQPPRSGVRIQKGQGTALGFMLDAMEELRLETAQARRGRRGEQVEDGAARQVRRAAGGHERTAPVALAPAVGETVAESRETL